MPADLSVVALVVLGAVGLAVGSFLNVVIVRLPADQPRLRSAWRCPQCEAALRPVDTIPVLSWVLLRGRCRRCSAPIGAGYPLVEAANAALWVAAGVRFGATWALVPVVVLFSTLLAQSVIDLELYRLLDRITFPVLGGLLVLVAAVSLIEGEPSRVLFAVGGAVGYFVFLLVPALLYPRGMGLGDVKLALIMGLLLGWVHPLLCLYAVISACLLGLVAGVVLYFARGRTSSPFPFGPWLALGCVLTIVFSPAVLDVYGATTVDFLAVA